MIHLPPKHSATGTTIFSVMSALAQQHGAINLSQGFPDFQIDAELCALLHEAAIQGHNQYAPMPGLPALRTAIAAGMQQRYGMAIDAEQELTITPGATYAIYTAFAATLQPGDEVIVLEPAYDSYIPNIESQGAVAVRVPLLYPDFAPDWERIAQIITPKTRAIIVNTPHNPTGAIWQQADWDQLADIIRDTQIVVLSDEVYEQLVYDGKQHYSVLQHPELRQRSFALYSFGKVYHNTGWKIGYCVAPPQFTQAFRHLHQYLCFSVNTPAQYALAAYLQHPAATPPATMLQEKRDTFLRLLASTPFTVHTPATGSYFQLASYAGISDMNDRDFAHWLTQEHGVVAIPVSAFYADKKDDKLLRFCFAKQEATLEAAAARLAGVGQAINSRIPTSG